ncbi:MAG TPA: type II toxin-antitoxin system HicB family antitoxin [Gemmatimonadota bacterium]|nr:type II toxin-antitoxin system HicB family antitoxin [Gemmatimonadota bacterium]
MKFTITMHQDEDGVFIAECPAIPGCISQGETEAEAEKNVREAIRECLIVREEAGMPLTLDTREVEVSI